jgi:endoglucanase
MLTEFGVPDDDPRWLTVLERFLGAIRADERLVGGVYWAGGSWWGTYPLSIEPRGGQVRPQMSVLSAFGAP